MGCDVIGQFDGEMSMYIAVEKNSYDVIHVSITPQLLTTNLCGVGNEKALENIASIYISIRQLPQYSIVEVYKCDNRREDFPC